MEFLYLAPWGTSQTSRGKRKPWSWCLSFWDRFEPPKLVVHITVHGYVVMRALWVCEKDEGIAQFYLQLRRGKMMMAGGGGGGAAVDHNGIFTNPNLHSLQQTHMDADNPDSRKRPLETPAEEAGCTKRTNTGGKRKAITSSPSTSSSPH